MRVLAFVYDFPHFKSAQGLFALARAGFTGDDVCVLGAPWQKLHMRESPFQFRTMDMDDAHHPRDVAKALGFDYYAAPHETAGALLKQVKCGLILGARILPKSILGQVPILNLHPGLLPENRGLDTLKWAVHDGLQQAISIHRIDARIDRGALLHTEMVRVHADDSPADIYNRLMWRQIALVPKAIELAYAYGEPVAEGVYRRPMTAEEDVRTLTRFQAWKARYAEQREAA